MGAGLRLEGSMIPRTVKRIFDERHEPRDRVDTTALLGWRASTLAVELVNLSPSGAMVTCPEIPHIGEAITLQLADRDSLPGVVRWVRDGRIGLHFTTPLK